MALIQPTRTATLDLEVRVNVTPHLVIVDDDALDTELTLLAVEQLDFAIDVTVLDDPEEAIRYLRRQGQYADRRHVNLVLLDIHMPRLSGFDVLYELRSDPALRDLPIVLHSTSGRPLDQLSGIQGGANAYIPKALDFSGMYSSLRDTIRAWTHAQTPGLPLPALN